MHEAVDDRVLGGVGVAQQHGERVERDQLAGHGGVEVEAEVDDVVGQPAGGEEQGQDDHHQRQSSSGRHLNIVHTGVEV